MNGSLTESMTIDVAADADTAFGLVADFGRLAEWDPGVVVARWLGEPRREGSECEVVARFLGMKPRLTYTLLEYDPPRRARYRGVGSKLVSIDTIEVEPRGAGCRIHFSAAMEPAGAMRLLRPLLPLIFRRQGAKSLEALRRALEDGA